MVSTKQLASFLNPTRWVAGKFWVRRDAILVFLTCDLIVAGFTVFFYTKFREVARLGWTVGGWWSYVFATGGRMAITLCGCYAVSLRKVKLTKVYYALFFFAVLLSVYVLLPVSWLKCDCKSWDQCNALAAFNFDSTEQLLNPFWEPRDYVGPPERRVPYEEPPMEKPEKPVNYSWAKSWARKRSRKDALVEIDSGSSAFTHSHFRNKHRNSLMPSALSMEAADSASQAERGKPPEAEALPDSGESAPAMHFFNLIPAGISLQTTDDACYTETLENRKAFQERAMQLDDLHLHTDKLKTLPGKVESGLFLCITESWCDAVSIELKQITDARSGIETFQSKVCHHEQVLPVIAGYIELKYYFLRNRKAIRDDLKASEDDESKFYAPAVKSLTKDDGMKAIQEKQEKSCMCEAPNGQTPLNQSCRTYQDIEGEDRHWCWVRSAPDVIRACEKEQVALYYDNHEDKLWTEGICTKLGCKCSSMGMVPDYRYRDISEGEIKYDNRLDFGGSCRKWRTTDKQPWCYSGFDSTCPDRWKAFHEWHEDPTAACSDVVCSAAGKRQWMQYQSTVACKNEEKTQWHDQWEDLVIKASNACCYAKIPTGLLLSLSTICHIPMLMILFNFLSNRCGDACDVSQQFDVVTTSDDEDDWAPRGANKNLDENSVTKPGAGNEA